MNRGPPPVLYSNKPQRRKIPGFSPLAKKQENLSFGTMHGQTSIHIKLKKSDANPIRVQSPAYSVPKAELHKLTEQKQLLNEQQIRNCTLYKMLQQQIRELTRQHGSQIEKLKKIRQQRKKESERINKEQFGIKLEIWELKNEVHEIKQLIQEEKNESERYLEEIRPIGLGHHRGQFGQVSTQQDLQLTENQQQSLQTQQES